jgi:hypothetical protein
MADWVLPVAEMTASDRPLRSTSRHTLAQLVGTIRGLLELGHALCISQIGSEQ